MRLLWTLYQRELAIARRIGGGGSMGLVFFLILVTIVPFAVGPDLKLLAQIGPAILWIAALLATLLALDRLLQADADDGSLDLLLMTDMPLEAIVLAKCAAHWTATSLPLALAAPFFGLMLGMDGPALAGVCVTLLVGTPALTLLGAIGAGLTVGLRRGGLLTAILVLPFTIPVLIFGVAAASAVGAMSDAFGTPFLILSALSLATLAAAPFAVAASVRLAGEA